MDSCKDCEYHYDYYDSSGNHDGCGCSNSKADHYFYCMEEDKVCPYKDGDK
jgi:hypothetical protein